MITVANGLADRDYSVGLVVGNARGGFREDVSDAVELTDLNASDIPGVSTVGVLVPFYEYLSQEEPRVVISSMTTSTSYF